ncbi:MAG: nuclear transport factor 2 family protein [OCS116 cluster bacterium]|nr:nuclear transport factor 2 family protein [OCS116 cluster bacterium]
MSDFKNTWETYTSAWKAETAQQKLEIFKQCLATDATYTDPLVVTKGWDELTEYMLEFHQQIPGGYFDTHYFLAHHDKSIAKWDMKTGDGTKIGEGISYGHYNADGKLIAMTGFYETEQG